MTGPERFCGSCAHGDSSGWRTSSARCAAAARRVGLTVADLVRAGTVADARVVCFDQALEVAGVTAHPSGGYWLDTVRGRVKAEGSTRVWLTPDQGLDVAAASIDELRRTQAGVR